MDTKTKICSKCKKIKNLEENFYKNEAYKDGYYSQCKECRNKHPSQTPEKLLDRVYSRRMRNRQFLWDYYKTHPCADCGNNDPIVLELHHLDPSQKIGGVSQLVHNTRSIKVIEEEIKKCEVVCANCHRHRTAKEQGWYLGINK